MNYPMKKETSLLVKYRKYRDPNTGKIHSTITNNILMLKNVVIIDDAPLHKDEVEKHTFKCALDNKVHLIRHSVTVNGKHIGKEDKDILVYHKNAQDVLAICPITGNHVAKDAMVYCEARLGPGHKSSLVAANPDNLRSGWHGGRSYRSQNNPFAEHVTGANGSRFLIGLEIEKEDNNVFNKLREIPLIKKYGWTPERDGSLGYENDNGIYIHGTELVSPILPLDRKYADSLSQYLKELKWIFELKHSKKSGGHIHISKRGMSASKLYDSIVGYIPIISAMYPKRIYNYYCEIRRKGDTRGEHYRAVYLTEYDTVEIRIFSSPKTLTTIQNRIDMLRYMVENPCTDTSDAIEALLNEDTEFNKIVTNMYKNSHKGVALLAEYALKLANMYDYSSADKVDVIDKFKLKKGL